ncbi:MAG: biopolymer transporter ExbD [Kiritimatiellia bacterium]
MERKKRKRKKRASEQPQLEMTPMIDVVFQLLIFFIVTMKPQDILGHLDVSRPAPDPDARPEEQVENLLDIIVYEDGYVIKGSQVSLASLGKHIMKLASYNPNISVVIRCTGDSYHSHLVGLLDQCSKAGLSNISVFSM